MEQAAQGTDQLPAEAGEQVARRRRRLAGRQVGPEDYQQQEGEVPQDVNAAAVPVPAVNNSAPAPVMASKAAARRGQRPPLLRVLTSLGR